MTFEEWTERKYQLGLKARMIIEKYRKTRGRRPQVYTNLKEIVTDADLMQKLRCMDFISLEQEANMWL